MRMLCCIASTFVVGVVVGVLSTPTVNAQFRNVKSNRLLTVDMAEWCNEKEVTVELNEIGPGSSGKHYHPGHSFTYVLEGSEEYLQEGKPGKTVRAGDVLHEEPMLLHTVDNQGPVKLLVVRVVEKGK